MPSEYDLDSNGEPRYDDVMSFIKRKNYFAGNFIADEVKDINNTLTSLGVDNINDLNDMIVSNFLPAVIYSSIGTILSDLGCMTLMRLIIS